MPTVTGVKLHGQNGAVFVQGFAASAAIPATLVNLAVRKWTGIEKWDKHDTSNTSVPGYKTGQKGKKILEFVLEAQLDITQLPQGVSGINLDADYCSVVLVTNQTSGGTTGGSTPATGGQAYNAPVCLVTEIRITSAENEIITYNITGESSGAYVVNAGS